ncbi:MAG: saccharopine dehydrogenase [Ignavibacteria bacterium]|jgi:saccharopine dehydrogenase-like NADP-dependent oxidoreductase|nr:saccharopine dehydrogenase [Ignavibacteria bacterium]MCU7502119.1 saccharopine dehydrogenase [Ignavibacteria bacterium]MCU7515521.1 saccharopine dehydrogenase [Ignavibacteria bacterium]
MKNVTVLGSGMIGSVIARDLAKKYKVTSIDLLEENLLPLQYYGIQTIATDLRDAEELRKNIRTADLVICAVPGFMGFDTLKTVISEGKNTVDISFFSEDPFLLDSLAKDNNLTAVIDCGVAPGMGNVILGHYASKYRVESYKCLVGGLPKERTLPFQYKAPFSPSDVLEEYTRPAKVVQGGKVVVKEALSEPEYVDIKGIGTLEAFLTDGLRTLIRTMDVPNMEEKTLRYPGHLEVIKALKDTGFFSRNFVDLGSHKLRPIDLTSKLLFPLWKEEPGEKAFTVMNIIISATSTEGQREITALLLDEGDPDEKTSSMARATGYTCTAAAELILQGEITAMGIIPPEALGKEERIYTKILQYLEKRNVHYGFRERLIT